MTKKKNDSFSLKDLPGIGPARATALEEAGLSHPLDIVIRGAQDVHVLTDMDIYPATQLVEKTKQSLIEEGLIPQLGSWKNRAEYEKKKIGLSSGCSRLDNMLKGKNYQYDEETKKAKEVDGFAGFESQSVYELYGKDGAGKTQMSLTLTAETINRGYGVLFLDCEDTFDMGRFLEICQARNIEPDLDLLHLETCLDSYEVMRVINSATKRILENNIKLMVIDGAIGRFRNEYKEGRGDLNPRQNRLKEFVEQIRKIAFWLNIVVVITNQVMGNPDPYSGESMKAVGGFIVGHAPKYIIWFKPSGDNKITVTFKKSNKHEKIDEVIYVTKAGLSDDPKEPKAKKKEDSFERDLVDKSVLQE